ncbi:DUF2795 domain-containing protein [Streptomyces sp. NPDC007100]|uniref:DUF2795 domain-containing protein n=1 Tax=unclassified Streptomyces TaxID=2593676 RepID=UPI0033FBCFD6
MEPVFLTPLTTRPGPGSAGRSGAPGHPGRPARPYPGRWDARELLRFELARHLERERFPAKRRALVRELLARRAPDQLVQALRALPPDELFRDVPDVVSALLDDAPG